MFLGHFAVGFAAKAVPPALSLGTLFLAAQFIDVLWPTFLLLGVEEVRVAPGITAVTPLDFVHYPYSHSLLAVGMWAILVGGGYHAVTRDGRGAAVLALAVLIHWFLDWLVHRPDLPLYPGDASRFGLGIWFSMTRTLVLELSLFAAALLVYARATAARDRSGTWGFIGLALFLLAIYGANLLGPPPPSETAIAWVGQAQWLLVLAGYWVDRHRHPRTLAP